MAAEKLYTSLSAKTIMAKLNNHFQQTRLTTSLADIHYSLDSEDDLAQFVFSELPLPRRSHKTNSWIRYSWVQTIYHEFSLCFFFLRIPSYDEIVGDDEVLVIWPVNCHIGV